MMPVSVKCGPQMRRSAGPTWSARWDGPEHSWTGGQECWKSSCWPSRWLSDCMDIRGMTEQKVGLLWWGGVLTHHGHRVMGSEGGHESKYVTRSPDSPKSQFCSVIDLHEGPTGGRS